MSQNYQRMYNDDVTTPLAAAPQYPHAPEYNDSSPYPQGPYHQPQPPYNQAQDPYNQPQDPYIQPQDPYKQPPQGTYPQSHVQFNQPQAYPAQGQAYTTQPQTINTTTIASQPATYQERPSHALPVGSLIFAIVTLLLSGGSAAICTVPAIILSSVALAQDYRADQARSLSIASLVLTGVFYICAIIVAVVVVIMVVTAEGANHHFEPPFPSYYAGSY